MNDKLLNILSGIDYVAQSTENKIANTIRQSESRTGTNSLGFAVRYTDEQIQANKRAAAELIPTIEAEREQEIAKMVESGEALIKAAEQENEQTLATNRPRADAACKEVIQEILSQYPKVSDMTFEHKAQILSDYEKAHANHTELEKPYYYIACELGLLTEEQKNEHIAGMFPKYDEALATRENISKSADMFRAGALIGYYNRNYKKLGFMDRISIKNKITELGYISMLNPYI